MGAASREAAAALSMAQRSAVGRAQSADELVSIATGLYAISDLLAGQPQLRRAVSDPSTDPAGRAQLLGGLLAGKVDAAASELAQGAARGRWSSAWDLTDGLHDVASDTLFAAAERDGALDRVEDELFRFERILDANGDLASLLDEVAVPAERRVGLVRSVVANKVHRVTDLLLEHAVASKRGRSVTFEVHDLLDQAASRRERSIARVLSAVPLSDEQQTRLAAALTRIYGRGITVRTAVDADVKGGLVVRVGDEIIDGSVAARLVDVRTALAG